MITLGIDIGSATSKCVLLRDGKDIIASSIVNGGIGTEGSEEARSMVMTQSGIGPEDIDYVVATGYGRSLYEQGGRTDKRAQLPCNRRPLQFSLMCARL